jgi:RNA polymerase sigma-70 factor (ECF subfamily)
MSQDALRSVQPASVEDRRLLALVAEGDPRARQMLAFRLVSRVRRISRALLRSSADADDAAQAALMAILEASAGFRGEGTLERWADRITVRTCLGHARSMRFRSRVLERFRRREPEPQPRDDRAGERVTRPVLEYLTRLSPRYRQVLVLKYALGYSLAEIAHELGVVPDTAKGRLSSARQALRKLVRRDLALGVGASVVQERRAP